LTQKQLGWLDNITAIVRDYEIEIASGGKPAEITRFDVFELLQVVDVVVKGNAEEIAAQAVNTYLGVGRNILFRATSSQHNGG
jgi:hypothetical protein